MIRAKSLVSDGVWLAALQGFASLGQLAGVRLLTEILPPAVFGEFSLLLGVVLLVATGLVNPTMQAVLRYYPEYVARGEGGVVLSVARQQLTKLVVWIIPAVSMAAVAAIVRGWINWNVLILLVALITLEIVRTQHTTILNATRSHRLSGWWVVVETWGRPILAWLVITFLGVSISSALSGFVLASLVVWAVMRKFVRNDKTIISVLSERYALASRFWKYTLPLLPLGLIGWISGMADRYMISMLLTPADVGLYVAIYGLASRPMLVFGYIVESTIRPVYMSAVAEGDHQRARHYLKVWAVIIILGSLLAIVLSILIHPWLARILLGVQYRSVSYLLPWIVGGYSLLILSYIANRVCYAHEATRSIFLVEAIGAIVAVVLGFLFIKWAGLMGAAIAVVFYFGVQLFVAIIFARKWVLLDKPSIV